MSHGKNEELMQHRRLQTSLFTIDLILLIFMSIYRIIGIFDTHLPTYVYYELFSSTLTIFTLTEFGLNIRMLFSTVAGDGRSQSGAKSEGPQDPNGSRSNKLEMTTMSSHRPRPLTNNSTSPLASNGAGLGTGSEIDVVTSPENADYVPYPTWTSNVQTNDWRYPYMSNDSNSQFYNGDALYNHQSSGPSSHDKSIFHEKQESVHRPSLTHWTPERPPAVPSRTPRSTTSGRDK
ncbi:hypothetical protein EDD21DRAFT_371016 [Dissophora ornata]|nr:hypothetical protein EDD21DRAFT_371016 [Dissophora ornata]